MSYYDERQGAKLLKKLAISWLVNLHLRPELVEFEYSGSTAEKDIHKEPSTKKIQNKIIELQVKIFAFLPYTGARGGT